MDNMKIWDAVKRPPSQALKTIQGGRLKGKSDINPQWRYQVMTEQFGVCGIGWKYEIVRLWIEPAPSDQVFAFAKINLYIKIGEEWSEAIPGVGGSMLVTKETSGLFASDEGYKMAITDALSTAMKMIGVAGDIYAGLWDGTKYADKPAQKPVKDSPDERSHWCKEHNTAFFMSGKMKAYAHPIEGSDQWCHEHKDKPAAVDTVQASKDAQELFPEDGQKAKEAAKTSERPSDSKTEDLLQWVADRMKWKTTKTARSWLVNACKIPEDKIDNDPSWVYSEVKALQGWTD